MATPAEVAAVDTFLASPKHLYGAPPEFGPTNFHRKGLPEWQAVWPMADEDGVLTGAELRVVARPGPFPSLSVIWSGQAVTRLDICAETECKPNPLWAGALGALPQVCGPHLHSWELNRGHNLNITGWEIPCREPLQPQIRRFEQAFPWLMDRINVALTPEQRVFDTPANLL